ncbi:MAG: FecR domain-containing protein [Rhodocyclaceae bacterium]|nr:FecR domain-containing protein [Rhodocyclaceae bacterium]MBX3666977.1 FecR domain-containing protein [Rhodocyclaceae bacterium]
MKQLCGLAGLVLALSVRAAVPLASVDQVQSPAWLERDGRALALEPGQPLAPGDSIRTGNQGKAYLRLAEGSVVKLGEQTRFAVDELDREADGGVRAAINVLKGAFRFTTSALAKALGRREVKVRVATITAGIRGTDIWGRSTDERDFVCLLEGRIEVAHEGGTRAEMDLPNSFFGADRGAAPDGVKSVDADQVKRWAAETEIAPNAGSLGRSGRWNLNLSLGSDLDAALDAAAKLRAAGYAAQLVPRSDAKGLSYAVELRGLSARADAASLAARVQADTALDMQPARR